MLTEEATADSLRLVSEIISGTGITSYSLEYISDFLKVCARIYPGHRQELLTLSSDHFFIDPFIKSLPTDVIPHLLDNLTDGLKCGCQKPRFECDCRNGISKIVGNLLDQYFLSFLPPFDPILVWGWVRNLNYHNAISAERSDAVNILHRDHALRRGIYRHALTGVSDNEEIRLLVHDFFMYSFYSHSGLCFRQGDREYILEMAFQEGNVLLWRAVFPYHSRNNRSTDKLNIPLRQICRQHANTDPDFMREWFMAERGMAATWQPDLKLSRKMRRKTKRDAVIHTTNLQYYSENQDEILSGQRWDILGRFAHTFLTNPARMKERYGDEALVKQSLINCLSHISTEVPDLTKLVELNMTGHTYRAEHIFFAASLLLLESGQDLAKIDPVLLRTLRVHSQRGYGGKREHCDALTAELDRIIFHEGQGTEAFLREYLEPQLKKGLAHPPLDLLLPDSVFSPVRGRLAIEWLEKIKTLTLSATSLLFRIACEENELVALSKIISSRCDEFQAEWPEKSDDEEREELRLFWLIRAFYFLPDYPADYWQWISASGSNLLKLNSISGRFRRGESNNWPSLTARMIKDILVGFTEYWYPVSQPVHQKNNEDTDATDARRFLHDIVYAFSGTEPVDAIPLIRGLINAPSIMPFLPDLKSVLASLEQDRMLRDYAPPSPVDITAMLDKDEVVTVEGLRETVLFHLEEYQRHVRYSEFNVLNRFYPGGSHLGEEASTDIITEWLNNRLQPKGVSVVKEHEVYNKKRADFSVTRMLGSKRLLLMVEVKGQWNKELYTAPLEQLYKRYSITPDARLQGIYVVLWFGKHEKVASLVHHGIESPEQLKKAISDKLPFDLNKQIDVFVLDLAR